MGLTRLSNNFPGTLTAGISHVKLSNDSWCINAENEQRASIDSAKTNDLATTDFISKQKLYKESDGG